jgi:hypothetical protein
MNPASRSPFGRMSGLHGLSDLSLKQIIAWGDHLKVDQSQIDAQHEAISVCDGIPTCAQTR